MAGIEVFRFVAIRPPRQIDPKQPPVTIDLTVSKSSLVEQLRKQRPKAGPAAMVAIAAKFTASADFVRSAGNLDQKLAAFASAVVSLPDSGFWAAVQEAFASGIGGAARDYLGGTIYSATFARVSDSIVAAAIDDSVPPTVRGFLVDTARALWLVQRLADSAPVTRAAFANAALILPAGIFPLPGSDPGLKANRAAKAAANAKALEARRKQAAQLGQDLADQRAAMDELLSAFELSSSDPAPAPATTTPATAAAAAPAAAPARSAGFVLPASAAAGLSKPTLSVLAKAGLSTTSIDIPKSVSLLERRSALLATQLYSQAGTGGTLVRIGQNFLPSGLLSNDSTIIFEPLNTVETPGPCPPAPDVGIPDDGPSVPTGKGDARVLGVADLLILEQTLGRYELGEISHIENVMRSEQRSRLFRTKDSTQVTQVDQTETTTEKEQDLSTDERFQLQTESQTVINDTASKAAGLTIHASYGPSVDATANYNTSSSSSTQQSNQASSTYAREVTSKAVQRVQTQTLTSRTVTTLHVATEVNRHGFDNTKGTDDIVGVYRFVDKIYKAQLVNYGKRLMLEFIVPEPAAFLRYAMTNRPIDSVTAINPDPPGYCQADGTTFSALQPTDITSDNYMYWAGKYGAQDVTSPPPAVVLAQGAKKAPDSMPTVGDALLGSDTFDIAVADGYLAQKAYVNIYGETQVGTHQVIVQIQDQQVTYVEPWQDQLVPLDLLSTSTVTVTVNSLRFHNWEVLVTVFCTRSDEKYHDWQLKTFGSIMNAYDDLKSAYDEAVREAKLQAADPTGSTGTNPETKVITQQVELKKGCISLMTGQRFDLFDAVNRNVAPYGYPEIDFVEAKAEGAYIAAFEQSFEWNNMVYLYYPYFWGKKVDWPAIAQLNDPDPVFQQFLQAGAARVQVPVRPGFEAGVLTYLSTGTLWSTDGTLVNADDGGVDAQALSIIDELRSQTGNNNVDGIGLISVTKDSAGVTGNGTLFTGDDINRRIIIAGATYVIGAVAGAESITLTTPYAGDTATDIGYATGGVLVGQPWEVRIPTNLVKLDNTLQFS